MLESFFNIRISSDEFLGISCFGTSVHIGFRFLFEDGFVGSASVIAIIGWAFIFLPRGLSHCCDRVVAERHNLSIECLLDFFDKIVKPILLYGCEVWGFSDNYVIEKIRLKFCKLILHLKQSTPNCMIYGELGRFPLYIDIKTSNILLVQITYWKSFQAVGHIL